MSLYVSLWLSSRPSLCPWVVDCVPWRDSCPFGTNNVPLCPFEKPIVPKFVPFASSVMSLCVSLVWMMQDLSVPIVVPSGWNMSLLCPSKMPIVPKFVPFMSSVMSLCVFPLWDWSIFCKIFVSPMVFPLSYSLCPFFSVIIYAVASLREQCCFLVPSESSVLWHIPVDLWDMFVVCSLEELAIVLSVKLYLQGNTWRIPSIYEVWIKYLELLFTWVVHVSHRVVSLTQSLAHSINEASFTREVLFGLGDHTKASNQNE